jgi:hypothetical protein
VRREIHSNHRLIVTPDLRQVLPPGDNDAVRRLLDDMAAAVRRHVDCVWTVGVEWDTRPVCSHCGYEWETVTADDLANRPDDYEGMALDEPVCCEKAAAEFRAQLGATVSASEPADTA